jgi:hypothetical protein
MPKPPLSPFLLDPTADTAPPEREAAGCADRRGPAGPGAAMDLDAAELFVVATLRAWVAPRLWPGRPHPDWRELFRLAGVGAPAPLGFDALMSLLGGQATRLIDVRCCACPGVGEDEAAMLRLVGAVQAGETPGARAVLDDWLPGEAIGPALEAARRLALGMAGAGLLLPRRGVVVRFPAAFPPARTLH